MLHEIDLSRTDLNLLVLFEVILEEGNVGRAAQRLNLSPSAVSHGLGRLRRLLDDPVFLRTPRGVVPTARAEALAEPISEALRQVRAVLGTTTPFDPGSTYRRFSIGAPDGVSAVIMSPLLARLSRSAPGLSLSVRQLLPVPGETVSDRGWRSAYEALDRRDLDIAVVPSDEVPARFHRRLVYKEDFVLAVREEHPLTDRPSIEDYCVMRHLVVSESGDPFGFVDVVLARHGHSRRIALTAPNFMFALAVLAETDMISALPRRFVNMFGSKFGVRSVEPPLPLGDFGLSAVAPASAAGDAGLAWLLDQLVGVAEVTSQ